MTYSQTIAPDPDIPCRPGWCLQYVREAFGLPARYASATEAWEASGSKHRGRDFPAGVWVPVWYAVAGEPLGHVVLLAPDGSVYSTSDLSTTPHHHSDLADLEWFYAYYGMDLTYRGWTEDVAGFPVIARPGLTAQGTITTTEEDQMTPEQFQILLDIHGVLFNGTKGTPRPLTVYDRVVDIQLALTRDLPILVNSPGVSAAAIAAAIPLELAEQVVDALANRIKGV